MLDGGRIGGSVLVETFSWLPHCLCGAVESPELVFNEYVAFLPTGLKQPSISAEVKNAWSYTSAVKSPVQDQCSYTLLTAQSEVCKQTA